MKHFNLFLIIISCLTLLSNLSEAQGNQSTLRTLGNVYLNERPEDGSGFEEYSFNTGIEIWNLSIGDSSLIENPRASSPFGISIYGGSPTLIASISLDFFIRPDISLEAGGGLFGWYLGSRYHFNGKKTKKKWTTYTGLMFALYSEQIGVDYLFFLPFGEQYVGKNGFNFAVEIMLMNEVGPGHLPLWFGVKFGYRF